ncbi:kinase-like protein [Xylaria sp. FL0064]|nr:kinase-like protein [Xylaria sp. FL0064]
MPGILLDDEVSSATTSSPTSTLTLEGLERQRKLKGQGSIMSLLRTLTHSASGNSIRGSEWPSPPPSERSPERHRLFKKMSLPFLRTPFGGAVTVIHRVKKKPRPSIRSIDRESDKLLPASAPAILSVSTSNSNTNSSGKSSGPTNGTGTTVATSFESKLSSKDNDPVEQRPASIVHHKEAETAPTIADPGLTTIQERAIDPPPPTIMTVERTAAAKIYLETYFNEKFNKPSPRSLRRRYLESELYHGLGLSPAEKDMRRALFCQRETNHLRATRVLAGRSISAMKCEHGELTDDYEILKILGKGSFGVVRLVRKRQGQDGGQRSSRVYAMKVIRKSAMLKTSQEGHLRAERDFLVASEGSRWIVPLIASFQDAGNLYLVMDYMPGGDFLGLLIRENILSEPVAKFYIAEMILCIEEAHSLRCIHRDIKPDNFLISATGHLKISDFGLAFDGHWSHDTSYYHTQRYSLLHKLGLSVEGDSTDRAEGLQGTMKWAQGVTQAMQKHARQPAGPSNAASTAVRDEPLLNWRNRCGNRSAARSCSLGVILYECLYGHTPFLSEEGGRQQTKRNIVNHEQTFAFPPRPVVSRRCMDLIASLVCARENRLSSKRYRSRDTGFEQQQQQQHPLLISSPARGRGRQPRDGRGRSVYPHDAEDIKAHKWFRDIPWEQLHLITPPFVPRIASIEDTHYFDEEEPISDWSESGSDDDNDEDDDNDDDAGSEAGLREALQQQQKLPALEANPLLAMHAAIAAAPTGECTNLSPFTPPGPPHTGSLIHNAHPSTAVPRSAQKMAAMQAQLAAFPRHIRSILAQFVASPYDSTRLKRMDREINALAAASTPPTTATTASGASVHFQESALAEQMKAFVRAFGRRERKRPRDRLLRDRKTKATVLRVRKETAFLGYTFRRVTDVAMHNREDEDVSGVIALDGNSINNRNSINADNYVYDNMTSMATFDGGERMPSPRVCLHGRPAEGFAGYREAAMGPVGGISGTGVGVGVVGAGVRPRDAANLAAYTALR